MCGTLIHSNAKFLKYNGMCGKCHQLSLMADVNADPKCFICDKKDTSMRMCIGFARKKICDDCKENMVVFCKDSHSKCMLDHKCCFCGDKREYKKEGTYNGYIDGIGDVSMKNRWDFYCSACCAHFYELNILYKEN